MSDAIPTIEQHVGDTSMPVRQRIVVVVHAEPERVVAASSAWVTIEEARRMLGNVSRSFVSRLVSTGKIPDEFTRRIGALIQIHVDGIAFYQKTLPTVKKDTTAIDEAVSAARHMRVVK